MSETTASTPFGMVDLFTSINRDWHLLLHDEPGECLFEAHIVSREHGLLNIANDVPVQIDVAMTEAMVPDVLCIPDIFVAPRERLTGHNSEVVTPGTIANINAE